MDCETGWMPGEDDVFCFAVGEGPNWEIRSESEVKSDDAHCYLELADGARYKGGSTGFAEG
jgi:hypothetical protein